MRNLIKTFILMLMLSFSHASIAGDLEDGLEAHDKGDFETALRLWTPLAEQGDAEAQLRLSVMYFSGEGVLQDFGIGEKWLLIAAEQGYIRAQIVLSNRYFGGMGLTKDNNKAIKWLKIAADQGSSDAHWFLGGKYKKGYDGVVQDYVKAHIHLNIAAALGNPLARDERDDLAKKMTPAQIEKAQEAATRCIKQNFKNCD